MSDVVYFFSILTKDTKGFFELVKFGRINKRINKGKNEDNKGNHKYANKQRRKKKK